MAKSSKAQNAACQKKIYNRFDCYEICHTFSESIQEHIDKNNQPIQAKFFIRSIIGVILAINAYLSHWGPWAWPSNYNIIVASIFIYYIGSFMYSKLSPVENCEGIFIGEYMFNGQKRIFTMKISDSMTDYTLDILDSQTKQTVAEKTFIYYEYFTEKGIFLEDRFQKHLDGFLSIIKK